MENHDLAPILLFVYKRLQTLKSTVTSLQENHLAKQSDLYIFSDAAKNEEDFALITEVRRYLKTISGFRTITIIEAHKNKGLANSIINGVSKIIKERRKVIVLEDDLITSSNFLVYMNKCLKFYERDLKVFSVSGYSFKMQGLEVKDVYFTRRASSWGWATWLDRWENIDWTVADYPSFKNNTTQRSDFNQMGSDLSSMLDRQMAGEMDSWAIRWCFHQFIKNSLTVFPSVSKVRNIGFAQEATNTKDIPSRYDTVLDTSNKLEFNLPDVIKLDPYAIKQFVSHYSISTRIKYKIINTLYNYYMNSISSKQNRKEL